METFGGDGAPLARRTSPRPAGRSSRRPRTTRARWASRSPRRSRWPPRSRRRRYALGSVLNHVLLHQTIIGEEALLQLAKVGETPDLLVGCTGGGSNFGGLAFPFLREKLAGRMDPVIRAVEPASCPSLTRGVYAYDFGDTAGMTPLMKMHTLGHDFIPDPIHAGGLRYHGMSPLISHIYELGLIEADRDPADRVLRGRRPVRPHRGHRAGAGADPRARRLRPGGAGVQGVRRGEGHPHRAVRARPPRPAGLRGLPRRHAWSTRTCRTRGSRLPWQASQLWAEPGRRTPASTDPSRPRPVARLGSLSEASMDR